jgi:hypothetical protein
MKSVKIVPVMEVWIYRRRVSMHVATAPLFLQFMPIIDLGNTQIMQS